MVFQNIKKITWGKSNHTKRYKTVVRKVRHRAAEVGKKELVRASPPLSEKLGVVKHIKDEPSC